MAMTMGTLGEMVMRRYTTLGGKRIGRPKVMSVRRGARKTKPSDIEETRRKIEAAMSQFREKARSQAAGGLEPKRQLGEDVPPVEAWRAQIQSLVSGMKRPKTRVTPKTRPESK